MTRRDPKKEGKGAEIFFFTRPTAEKKNLNGLVPFSKRYPYVSRVTRRVHCTASSTSAAARPQRGASAYI